ncbi:MAG: sugar transferase [Saccharofermentans sp.]|nr:sugar transferase [Saccharofermentans sp.]
MDKRYKTSENSPIKHLDFMLFDYVLLAISFAVAYYIKFLDMGFITEFKWRGLFITICLINLGVVVITGAYNGILERTPSEELLKTTQQAFLNFITTSIVFYVLKIGAEYSRTTNILLPVFFLASSFTLRLVYKEYLRRKNIQLFSDSEKSIFVIGRSSDIPHLIRSINSGFFKEYSISGLCVVDSPLGASFSSDIDTIDEQGKAVKVRLDFKNNVELSDVLRFVLENRIDEVFVGVEPSMITPGVYKALIENGKGIHIDIESMLGIPTDNQLITTIGTNKTVSVGVYSFTGKQLVYLVVKRIIDIMLSIFALLFLIPVLFVVKLCYLFTGDFASIFYTQTRVGLNGKPFNLLKLRSMVHNSDEVLEELLKIDSYRSEWEANQKFANDPRITKVGSFLRKTSLDEVPQFINVLKGEMSLVGPRPLVEGELESHNGLQLYNQLKPGITGWWGCNGRSNTTYEERLELEYYYIKNCSLYLDALCIFKTIGAIFSQSGAQ